MVERVESPRATVTFLMADVEGSARLLGEHRALLRGAIEPAGGAEVEATGDPFLAAFSSAAGAVGAAVTAQRALADANLRIGIHTGEVSRGRRVREAAQGGQILVSGATHAIV
jgi:class 3 adenylate cyclase